MVTVRGKRSVRFMRRGALASVSLSPAPAAAVSLPAEYTKLNYPTDSAWYATAYLHQWYRPPQPLPQQLKRLMASQWQQVFRRL
jgi:hypothetical protein